LSVEIGKSGVRKDGSKWQITRYKIEHPEISTRWFSTFKSFPDVKAGDYVNIVYIEKPNPMNPKFPYLNIEDMELTDEKAERNAEFEGDGLDVVEEIIGGEREDAEERKLFNMVEPGEVKNPDSPFVSAKELKPSTDSTVGGSTEPVEAVSQPTQYNNTPQQDNALNKAVEIDRSKLYGF